MTHPFSYEKRRVVVTGAARCVGAALLDVLADLEVAHVTVLDVEAPEGRHDACLAVDLSGEASVQEAIAQIEGPVHALFNNAGVGRHAAGPHSPLRELPGAAYALRGFARSDDGRRGDRPHRVARRQPLAQARGEINALLDIDIADGWASALRWFESEQPELGQSPYNFSKEVIEVYTMRSSRQTMRQGVRTNSACPGPIDTGLLPDFRKTTSDTIIDWNIREMNRRPVAPREVATVLAFFGSPAAAYVNGVNVDIDGSFTAALATGQVDFSGRT